MRTYKKLDIAYLAGLFDGEGCVYVALNENKKYKKSYYSLMIHLSNCDPKIIDWLANTFGGRTAVSKPGTGGRRKVWIWWVRCQKAKRILKLMLPHLKIKKGQTEIALAMQETFDRFGGSARIDPAIVEFRRLCKEQISALNHQVYKEVIVGPHHAPNLKGAHSAYDSVTGV